MSEIIFQGDADMRIILILLITAFTVSSSFAYQLKWIIPEKERLEMVKTAQVQFIINGKLRRKYEERNIIDLTCYKAGKDASHVKGEFTVFRREEKEKVFKQKEKNFSDFQIESDGHFSVTRKYYMPNLRHLPTFPDKDLKIGDKWSAHTELFLNNFSRIIKLSAVTEYTLAAVKTLNGIPIAIIKYKFEIKESYQRKKIPFDFPAKIAGKNIGVFYWDMKNNAPLRSLDEYGIVFLFLNKAYGYKALKFRMKIESNYTIYPPISRKQKEEAKKEIEKEIKDKGITVDTNKKGIVLRMGEVLFDFDSFKLRSDTQKTLDKVIGIIKRKYADREIIVEGHTDSVGKPDYNQKLSENRARSVSEYLKNGIKHDKFSYKGLGEKNPLADNKIKEGRQKNRRVEITIKLN